MLNNRLKGKSCFNISTLLLMTAVLFVPPVFAGEAGGGDVSVQALSAQSMINRIADQIPMLMRMVTAFGYVIGMYFIYVSLLKFKEFGEQRTMMSAQHHLKEPLTYLIMGALLLYLPSSVQVGMSTFWADPSPYGYLEGQDQWQQFMNNCFMAIQLFGTIAFIRGLVILSHTGGQGGGGQGQFAKGVTHVIGGVFCINIYQFVKVILFTLGIQT
jgi:intracellular multiplication protein IcmC